MDPEEHARRREERLVRDRANATKLGKFLLIAAAALVVVGFVVWGVVKYVRRNDVPPVPDAVATSTVESTASPFPAGTFEVGDEVRVAKGKDTINQRKEPKTSAAVVTTLVWPQRVRVQDRVMGADGKVWYQVVAWDGTNEGPAGWVRGDLVEKD
ncbi:MAG: SH3 domain-containing protein [Actinobacteria bacterium]|nr:MAG: SH3 domain-containing protein [Actinomycetota bacterium]